MIDGAFVERVVTQARYCEGGERIANLSRRVWKTYGGEDGETDDPCEIEYSDAFERRVRVVLNAMPSIYRLDGSRYLIDPQGLEV